MRIGGHATRHHQHEKKHPISVVGIRRRGQGGRQGAVDDPGKPDTKTYAQGTLRIRLTHTYGSTGGAAGNVVKTVFEYSDDDGVNFEPLTDYLGNYVKTIGYHATRFIALTDTWSNIP